MEKGVLLLHGFGASRWEMQTLEECLRINGFGAYNARIAGHEESTEDFSRTTWQDWHSSAKKAYEDLIGTTGQRYIIGFSMGGTLASMVSQHYRPSGLVMINAPVWLKDKRAMFAGIIKHFMKAVDVELTEEERGHKYSRRPITAIEQLNKLLKINAKGLGKIESPTLIIQSTEDPTIEPKSAKYLYDKILSEDRQLVWYDSDEHTITRNPEEKIFPTILEFLRSH